MMNREMIIGTTEDIAKVIILIYCIIVKQFIFHTYMRIVYTLCIMFYIILYLTMVVNFVIYSGQLIIAGLFLLPLHPIQTW